MNEKKIIAIIPAYNEVETIGEVVRETRKLLQLLSHINEVWVIDDDSSDGTSHEALLNGAMVHRMDDWMPLAEVFRQGMKIAIARNAALVLHIDSDGQYCPTEIIALVRGLSNGAQLVVGSRFLGKIEAMPFLTKIGNRFLTLIVSIITGIVITDALSGFRAFTIDVAKLEIKGKFTYTQSQIIAASSAKYSICEVPVTFRKRKHGKSRLVRFRLYAGAMMLIDIVKSLPYNLNEK